VVRETSAADRALGLLLAGGISHADLVVRQAQSHLRLDRLPSRWSDAVLILDWPAGAGPGAVVTAGVALHHEDPLSQVPERNGVTLGDLRPFHDARRYPNLAFAALPMDAGAKERLRSAALDPMRDPARFALWDWLGVWRGFAVTGRGNPLLEHVPHPGAAYCELVYEAAGIDLTPGADAPHACPEVLWATLCYWYDQLVEGAKGVQVWRSLGDEGLAARQALSRDLTKDFKGRTRRRR
jgi:hypothetical protein